MILSFSDALVAPIQARTKIHTFRAGSRWRAGMLIHFYAQSRRPGMYLFFPVRPVVSVQAAELSAEGMHVDGRRLEGAELELFARRDGFATAAEFLAFFQGRALPLVGQLIHWTPVRYGVVPAPNENGTTVASPDEARQLSEDYLEEQARETNWLDDYPEGVEQYEGGPGVDYDPRC